MADVDFTFLGYMFITVLLASLIGGLITVKFSQYLNNNNKKTQPDKSRDSTQDLTKSLTPNNRHSIPSQQHQQVAQQQINNSIPSQSQIAVHTIQSLPSLSSQQQQPIYTQNTNIIPTTNQMPPLQSNIFSYPHAQTNINSMTQQRGSLPLISTATTTTNATISNTTNSNQTTIPPAPTEPPTCINTTFPPTQQTPTTPGPTHKQRNFTDLLKEQYQPSQGNIADLRDRNGNNNNNTLITPNPYIQQQQQQQSSNPPLTEHQQRFGSSHKLAFDRLDAEILKLPAQSSVRVTEKINVHELKSNEPNDTESPSLPTTPNVSNNIESSDINNNNNKSTNGKKLNFFTLPPININLVNNNINNINGDKDDGLNGFNGIKKKKSFPDDLSPQSLTPHSADSIYHHHHHYDHNNNNNGATKIVIVCYKLPLKCSFNKETSEWEFEWEDIRNVLANLRVLQSSAPSEYEINFVGWPGITPSTFEEQETLEDALYSLKYPCYPIFLLDSMIRDCYKIYCRSILWPLFHYLMPTNDYQFGTNYELYWQSYVGLNNLYAKKACVAVSDTIDNDTGNISGIIWFHDYHLLLAPHYVRRQIPLAQIGLFLHTTFPTSEVFRCLPTRKEILRGILSSDLVGFHTYDYARHFLSSCKRILDLDFHTLPDDGTLAVHYLGRDVSLRIGHASILSHDIHKTSQSQKVRLIKETYWKKRLNIQCNKYNKKIILGLGELDEVRGTILTIQSFNHFLLSHPEWQNDIIFILCISSSSNLDFTPSSHLISSSVSNLERSTSYNNLRRPIDDEINKMKLQFNKDVIQLIDSNNLSYNQLLALYTLCDVAVFGTFWDGFNTVPYEFTAAQPSYNIYNNIYNNTPFGIRQYNDHDIDDERGVPPAVILSEFMGCMRSLCGVFRINPWKISQVASTLHTALCMTSKERRVAHHRRFSHVMKYTLIDWSVGFINDLQKAAKSERNKRVLPIGFGSNLKFIYIPNDLTNLKQIHKLLISSFKSCKYKILLFDYGGTLTDVDEMKGDLNRKLKGSSSPSSNNRDKDKDRDKNGDQTPDQNMLSYRDLLGITKDLQTISPKIIRNLQRLSSDPYTIVAIISGQTRENLEKAFNLCPNLLICAEKGAWFRYPGQLNWVKNEKLPKNDSDLLLWQNIVGDVLKTYTERTNGSYIQKKSTALVWHYENADPHYGDMQATEAERYLRRIIEKHHNLVVQRYDHCRALEVLPKEIHKGSASLKVIDEMMKKIEFIYNDDTTGNNIFIMAVGNDRSDEKMFEAVELCSKEINTEYGFTVRIGMVPTQARFYLTDQNQMLWLLNTLTSNMGNNNTFQPLKKPIQSLNVPINNIPIPTLKKKRSHSYSKGLSKMAGKQQIHTLPIPPTAPTPDNNNNNNNNNNNTSFDLVSPEYSGSFFDNVAVRSHSYTSLSKLAKLSELTEQSTPKDTTPSTNNSNSSSFKPLKKRKL